MALNPYFAYSMAASLGNAMPSTPLSKPINLSHFVFALWAHAAKISGFQEHSSRNAETLAISNGLGGAVFAMAVPSGMNAIITMAEGFMLYHL
jgi:hypothetical protein